LGKAYFIFLLFYFFYSLTLCLFQKEGLSYFKQLIFCKSAIKFSWLRDKFSFLYINGEYWPGFSRLNTYFYFIKPALIGTNAFIIFFVLPSRDKILNFISICCLIYTLSILIQNHKLISYCGLIIPMAALHIRRFIYPFIMMRFVYLLVLLLAAFKVAAL